MRTDFFRATFCRWSALVGVIACVAFVRPAASQTTQHYADYLVGVYLLESNNPKAAVDHLEYAWRHGEQAPKIGHRLAEAYYLLKNFTRAEMVMDTALDHDVNDAVALVMKAKIRYIRRDADTAVALLLRAREHNPPRFDVEQLLGNIEYERGNHAEAAEAYGQCVAIDPNYPYIFYRYGVLLRRLGRNPEAETALKSAAEIDPGFAEPLLALAELYVEQHRDNEAVALLEYMQSQGLSTYRASMTLADLYLQRERFREGVVLMERLSRERDLDREGKLLLGRFYLETKAHDNATRVFTKMYADEPGPELARVLGEVYLKAGDADKSREHFEAAIAHSPDDYRSYVGLFFATSTRFAPAGSVPIEMELEERIALLDRAARHVAGHDFEGNYMVGLSYLSVDQLDAAAMHLGRAHELRPDNPDALLNLANVCERQHRLEDAERHLVRLHGLAPNDPVVANFYGYVLAQLDKDLDKAHKLLQISLAADPDNGYYLDSFGWILYQQGDYRGAVTALEQAAARVPDDPVILEHLGDAHRALRNYDKATAAYQRSSELQIHNEDVLRKLEEATRPRP